jgi:chorismate mutase / prephenate dehydratase
VSDAKREIEELRQEIAKLDASLLVSLEKRARASKKIGELRKDTAPSLPLTDRASLAAIVARATGDMPPDALREIFREVFAACLSLELPVPVVFLGPEGGAGHAAARERFGAGAKFISHETAALAFEELTTHRAQFAVVPIETRAEGPVQATITSLTPSDLKIVSVFDTSSNLQLLSRTGNIADVEKVYATPVDRAHCQRFFAQTMPKASVLDVKTPLVACQLAFEDHGAAAIATEAFGAQLGLEIARRNVKDGGDEKVRYAVVGTRPSSRTGNDLTALVFAVQDAPGSLLDVLKQFAERGINLTKIQSRPAPGEAWAYIFYVEVIGHATDRALVTATEEIRRQTKFFKVLGSYPAVG